MSSWLSNRLGLHINLRPLAAPAGAILGSMLLPGIGTALGAGLGAGAAKTADNLFHHDSIGHALGQGVLNGGAAYLGAGGLSKLKSIFDGSGDAASAAGSVAQSGVPGGGAGAFTPSSAASAGDGFQSAIPDSALYGKTAFPGSSPSLVSRLGSGAASVGRFAQQNPLAAAMGLQGVGNIAQAGSENAYRKAQTHAIDLSNQQSQYEQEAKKRRDAAIAPLLALFQGQVQQLQQHPYQIGANPYTSQSTRVG